jgi:hypothetical protein
MVSERRKPSFVHSSTEIGRLWLNVCPYKFGVLSVDMLKRQEALLNSSDPCNKTSVCDSIRYSQ